jgi:hypothetical protein
MISVLHKSFSRQNYLSNATLIIENGQKLAEILKNHEKEKTTSGHPSKLQYRRPQPIGQQWGAFESQGNPASNDMSIG